MMMIPVPLINSSYPMVGDFQQGVISLQLFTLILMNMGILLKHRQLVLMTTGRAIIRVGVIVQDTQCILEMIQI